MLRDRGTLDTKPTWVPAFHALGVDILYLGDFHDDSDIRDPGPKRFMEETVYFDGAQRLSDENFPVIPAEEPNVYFGGHWYLMTPKPIFFSHAVPRPASQSFEEEDPTYGHVYHVGSDEDVFNMVKKSIDETSLRDPLLWHQRGHEQLGFQAQVHDCRGDTYTKRPTMRLFG